MAGTGDEWKLPSWIPWTLPVITGLFTALALWQPWVEEVRPGNALGESEQAFGTAERRMTPGDEWIVMLAGLENASERSLTITSIEPERIVNPHIGRLVSVRLGRNDSMSGMFITDPPVLKVGKRCVVQTFTKTSGLVLDPGDEVFPALHVRALDVGNFKIEGLRVGYVQDGHVYSEVHRQGVVGRVRRTGTRFFLFDEWLCRHRTSVLPAGASVTKHP